MPLPKPEEILNEGTNQLPSPNQILPSPESVLDEPPVKKGIYNQNVESVISNMPGLSEAQKNRVRESAKSGADIDALTKEIVSYRTGNAKSQSDVWGDKPNVGLGEYLYNSLASGSARLGASLSKAPGMAYDIAAAPFNYVLSGRMMNDLTPVPISEELRTQIGMNEAPLTSEKFGKELGIKNKVAKYYDADVKARQAITQAKYDKEITDYFAEGDIASGLGKLSGAILESAPTTISLMMGNAAGLSTAASIGGGGLVFAADKKAELDQQAPHLNEQEKINIALSNGLFEGLFEQFGVTKLGGLTKDILLKTGKEEAKKIAEQGFKSVYKPTLSKFLGESVAEESLSEAATQFAQNAVDKYSGYKPDMDIMEGVVDAAIIGAASGGAIGSVPAMLQARQNKKTLESAKNLSAFYISQQGEDAYKLFNESIDLAVENGDLTAEKADEAKLRVDRYKEYESKIAPLGIDNKLKEKIFELSFQKEALTNDIKGVNKDDLDPISLARYESVKKQAGDIQKQIDEIVLTRQIKEEPVVADKTQQDVQKKEEQKTELFDADMQAEIDRYKEETGYLPEKEVRRMLRANEVPNMNDVEPTLFNDERKYNHRVKYEQVARHIEEDVIDGIEKGFLTEKEFTEPGGKKNSTYYVQLPTGHRIRLSSSMQKPTDFRGYMRTEHLPNKKGEVEGFPVGMKVVRTPPGANGETTAIKIFNAKTGKFISWAKATTRGEDVLELPIISADEKFAGKKGITKDQKVAELKRREVLAREEMADRNENPFDTGEGTTPTKPVKPVAPITPTTQTTIQTAETQPSVTPAKTEKPLTYAQKKYNEVRKKVRSNINKYISGKKFEAPEEGATLNEIELNERILSESENPAELAQAYLSAQEPSVEDAVGSKEGLIYEYFKNGGKLSTKSFIGQGDRNFLNRKDLPGIRTYVSATGKSADLAAREMMENAPEGMDIGPQDVIDFINNNPRGLVDFESRYNNTQKGRINNKYYQITGERLNDNIAKAIVDEVNAEQADYEANRDLTPDEIAEIESYQAAKAEFDKREAERAEIETRDLTEEEISKEEELARARREYEQGLDEGDQYQKEKSQKETKSSVIDRKDLDKIVEKLKKSMPKVKVVLDENLTDNEGNAVAGKWDRKNNTVSINPFYAGKDTPIHEYGHVLIDAIGYDNKVIQAAIKQLKGTDLWKETEKRYPGLSEQNLGKEVLAEAIGMEGEGIFDTQAEKSKFKVFLDYIFDWLKTKLGMNKNIAKSLAKQIVSGIGTKEMMGEGVGDAFQRPKYEVKEGDVPKTLSEFRFDEMARKLDKESLDLEFANSILLNKDSTEKEKKEAQGLKNAILARQRMDKKYYAEYLSQFKESKQIEESEDLSNFTMEELIDAYYTSSNEFDGDRALNKAVKNRLGLLLTQQQIDFLEKNNPLFNKEDVNKKDLTWREKMFKSISDAPGYLPGVQSVAKALNLQVSEKAKEIREKGEKLNKLAKAVIREKNKKLGIIKGNIASVFSSDAAKYFEYLDNGKGGLITKEEAEAKGLSKAQKDYRDYIQELNDLRNAVYDENDQLIENDIMKMDKGIRETYRTEGFLSALNAWLGKGLENDLLVEVKDEKGITSEKEYGQLSQDIINKATDWKKKVSAGLQLAKLAYKAKANKEQNPYINYKGSLTMKFDKPRPQGKGYSKDFHAAAMALINDYAHVKHMGPLIPLFDSVHYLYEKGMDNRMPNVAEFIKDELQDKIYQNQKGHSKGVPIDVTLKFFRRLGSLSTMAFNVPANLMNIAVGNYNNWRKVGIPFVLKGNARLFTSDNKPSAKGIDLLKEFDVVKFDKDSNPNMTGAGLFDKLAYFVNQIGEYQIQGSMFLGHLTDSEWDSFDVKDGKIVLKNGVDEKAFKEKMLSYKDKVSGIQGKYDEKDRRMFMRGEIGKSIAQYKTWMPDWFKSRFGKEFINKYGETERGSWNMFTEAAMKEIKSDFSRENGYGFKMEKVGGVPIPVMRNEQVAANLRGAMAVAAVLIAQGWDDDEDKKKGSQYFNVLSLENAMGNLLFIFDPDQLKYTIKNPSAIQGTVTKFIDALDATIRMDGEKALKNWKKLTPYNKVYDNINYLIGVEDDKKKKSK